MLARTVCILVACLGTCVPLTAQDEPKSKSAKEALAQYEKNVAEARKTYDAYHAEALKILIGFLDESRRRALEDNDLDEAQRIVAKTKEAAEALKNLELSKASTKFEIVIAYWGVTAPGSGVFEKNWVDVTKSLQKRVKLGRLSLKRPPDDFKQDNIADPWPMHVKSLVIVYVHNGMIRVAILDGWQPLTLPK